MSRSSDSKDIPVRSTLPRFVLFSGFVFGLAALLSCTSTNYLDEGLPGDFYVDSELGNDANSGMSPDAPWRSLASIASGIVPPGSTVHLKAGSAWRERLFPKMGLAGAPVTYTSYGTGAKPLLLGSLQANEPGAWSNVAGTGLWKKAAGASLDVGNILWVSAAGDVLAYGRKKWSRSECSAQGDFWYDGASDSVELWSNGNPAALYDGASVELAMGTSIITMSERSWMIFDGLDLRFAGGYGFQGKSVSDVEIRDCDISWIGGSELPGLDGVRYGNGVEFFKDASRCLVENNRIFEVYDTALTNQCYENAIETDITYRNNVIWNCGYASIEVWNRGTDSVTKNIVIEHNTCYAAGEGWGGDQCRPDDNTAGTHLRFDEVAEATSGLYVRNNVFSEARTSCAFVLVDGTAAGSWHGWQYLVMDYNCWYDSDGDPLWAFFNPELGSSSVVATYGLAELSTYRADLGKDQHSIAADPQFMLASASGTDLALKATSPCIDAGIASEVLVDRAGTVRSYPPDIGAYERF